jgi:stage III sporulation protein AH
MKTMKMKRNQIIITALVVMVAVAGYLNYADSAKNKTAAAQMALDDSGNLLGPLGLDDDTIWADTPNDPTAMQGDALVATSANGESSDNNMGEAVFVSTQENPFFMQAKLEREQARAKQKEILMGMINDDKLDEDKRSASADAMLEIQKRIEKETATEAMIEAKGFKEVYVRIDDNTVDVVVNKDALSDAEIAQIEDIVKRKTGMTPEQIRISAMKKS